MKYSIQNYVNSLTEVLKESSRENFELILKNFVKIILKNGDISKRDKIIEAVHKKTVQLNGGHWINIELARELSEPKMRIIKEAFSEKDFIDFKINPTLVAGLRITVDGNREIDNTLKNKLKKMFV